MTRTLRVLVAAAGFLAVTALLLAQSPAPHPALSQPAPAASRPAAPAPTPLEKAQLENIQLKLMLLDDEERSIPERRQQLQQQYGAMAQQIQGEHPGYLWSPQQGALVAIPKPAAKPEVKK
jgi:methionine-rich copper-binding protein CopC